MRAALQLLGGLALLVLLFWGTNRVEGCLEPLEKPPPPHCAAPAAGGDAAPALASALLAQGDALLLRWPEAGPIALTVGGKPVVLAPPGATDAHAVLEAALGPLAPETRAALRQKTSVVLWQGAATAPRPGWSEAWGLNLFHDELSAAGCLARAPSAADPAHPLSRHRFNDAAKLAAKVEARLAAALDKQGSTPLLAPAERAGRAAQAERLLLSSGVAAARQHDLPDAAWVLLAVLLFFYWRTADAGGELLEIEWDVLDRAGAYRREPVAAGRRERLVAYGLLHANLQHLLNNALALWLGAYLLEPALGPARTVLVFLAGVLGAGLVRHALDRPGMLVGASGGTFALKGAALALALRAGPWVPVTERHDYLVFLGLLLVLGLVASFMPGVSLVGHAGGAAAGALVAASGLLTWGRPSLEGGPESALAGGAAWALAGLGLLAWIGAGLLAGRAAAPPAVVPAPGGQ